MEPMFFGEKNNAEFELIDSYLFLRKRRREEVLRFHFLSRGAATTPRLVSDILSITSSRVSQSDFSNKNKNLACNLDSEYILI